MKTFSHVLSVLLSVALVVSLLSVAGVGVFAEGDNSTLVLDELISLTFQEGDEAALTFTPEKDGSYTFFSIGHRDSFATLYADDGEIELATELAYDDDSGAGNNFLITYDLTVGTKYTLLTHVYGHSAGSFQVGVGESVDKATDIFLSTDSVSLYVGQPFYLSDIEVTLEPIYAPQDDLSWSSSDTDILIDDYGDYKAIATGSATLTVTCGDLTADVAVTVLDPVEVSLGKNTIPLTPELPNFTAAFTPEKSGAYEFYSVSKDYYDLDTRVYDSENFLWSLDFDGDIDADCIKSSNGNDFYFQGVLEAGKTYCLPIYNCGDVLFDTSFELVINELSEPTTLTFAQGETMSGYVSSTITLDAVFGPEGAMSENLTWTSSDSEIASFDYMEGTYAQIDLNNVGTAVITAEAEGELKATCTVTVKEPSAIALDETVSIPATPIGQISNLVLFTFTPAEDGTYAFASTGISDMEAYMGVSLDGESIKMTEGHGDRLLEFEATGGTTYQLICVALRYGSFAKHTAISGFDVVVTNATKATGAAFVYGDSFEGCVGDYLTPSLTFTPALCTPDEIKEISSDNPEVADYFDGDIILCSEGKATITATTYGELTATLDITVSAAPTLEEDVVSTVPGLPLHTRTFEFTPDETAMYYFTSYGDTDTCVEIEDNESFSFYDNDSGDNHNFAAECVLTEGVTYYVSTYCESYANVGYRVLVSKDAEANETSVTSTTTTETTTATEAEPTVTEAEPTATEAEPTATEAEPTATEAEPTATATGTEAPFALLGDANNDGAVNMKDVLVLRKYLAGLEVTIDLVAADTNNDGAVNMKDVLQLRKFLAGLADL